MPNTYKHGMKHISNHTVVDIILNYPNTCT